jgi:hypothetical protein
MKVKAKQFSSACCLLYGSVSISRAAHSGSAPRPYIGVAVIDIDAAKQKSLGLKDRRGAYVFSMDKNSTAARAGIRIGDVIRMIDGKIVKTMHSLVEHMRTQLIGSTVNIVVLRNGVSRKEFYVKVGSRTADRPASAPDQKAEERQQREIQARSDRMRPARLDKVKLLRAKLRPWAIKNKGLLKAMLKAKPGDETALQAVINAIPANPGSQGLGITPEDLMPQRDHQAAALAGTPMFTWQASSKNKAPANLDPKRRDEYARSMRMSNARISNNFALYRDFEVSTSMGFSRSRFTLWASGRVTESESPGPHREIMPQVRLSQVTITAHSNLRSIKKNSVAPHLRPV